MKHSGFIIILFVISGFPVIVSSGQVSYRFSFSPGNPPPGYKQVLLTDQYSDKKYGFDFGTRPTAVDRKTSDLLTSGFCTGSRPIYFSVEAPEGNYNVKIILGDARGSSLTTVKAESRRLMLEKVQTDSGKFITCTFTVNIRTPKIAGTSKEVKLNQRELNKLDWDDKLTLEFCDVRPCVCAVEITPAENVVTVFLAGNSTVVDQDTEPWASWGQMIPRFFKEGVSIANHAESGLALGSFLGSNRLEKVLSIIKPGDYLFIEFGHNDQKEKGPEAGAYNSYSRRMKIFVDEARKKGGIPVIVTPANRRTFGEDGKITNSLGDYPDAARKIAAALSVPLIDLNTMTKTFYEALGPEISEKAFVIYPANTFIGQTSAVKDNTHFNVYGAYELAKCILKGIEQNSMTLQKLISDDFTGFDPGHPDPVETISIPLSSPAQFN
jgi:lysophospholipase L1-like esterase